MLEGLIERVEGFTPGQRVILTAHGRDYATFVSHEAPTEDGRPTVMINVDGRAYNPQRHLLSGIEPAIAPRDMVIGDLLNLAMLKEAFEVEFLGSLWVHGDSGMMTPHVCECSFGDGLKLLKIATINQRPNYHIVRVHSGWSISNWDDGDTVGEHSDEIISAIEEECGEKYWVDEECVECDGYPCHCKGGDPWPAIDADGGCSWDEIDWPHLLKRIGYPASLRARISS